MAHSPLASDGSAGAHDASAATVTRLLSAAAAGQPQAARELLPLVYRSLHALAERQMHAERPGHTLQATALVHEAYVRLVEGQGINWDSRAHFYAAAAEAMRRILIEHARRVGAKKRGGGWQRAIASVADLADEQSVAHAVDLDAAIEALRSHDARAASVTQLRFYAGLSVDETASALNIAPSTVDRDWRYARAWLLRYLQAREDEEDPRD
jgi:RNA polymerase sigma factor (TIGR02999 family)